MPASILRGGFSNLLSEWDNPIGAFEHGMVLNPGEEKEFMIVVGCDRSLEEVA